MYVIYVHNYNHILLAYVLLPYVCKFNAAIMEGFCFSFSAWRFEKEN